jgi:hypothetical protein
MTAKLTAVEYGLATEDKGDAVELQSKHQFTNATLL